MPKSIKQKLMEERLRAKRKHKKKLEDLGEKDLPNSKVETDQSSLKDFGITKENMDADKI